MRCVSLSFRYRFDQVEGEQVKVDRTLWLPEELESRRIGSNEVVELGKNAEESNPGALSEKRG